MYLKYFCGRRSAPNPTGGDPHGAPPGPLSGFRVRFAAGKGVERERRGTVERGGVVEVRKEGRRKKGEEKKGAGVMALGEIDAPVSGT